MSRKHEHPGDAILHIIQILAIGRRSTATRWQRERADKLIANLGTMMHRIGLLIAIEAIELVDDYVTDYQRRCTAISDRLILAKHPDVIELDARLDVEYGEHESEGSG